MSAASPETADHAWEMAFKQSVVQGPAEKTAWLLDVIGPRFVTVGVGMSDARAVKRWAGGVIEPREHVVARRLTALFRVSYAILMVYDKPSVVTAFLRSANPQLDDRSPLSLIGAMQDLDGADAPVMSATRAFLEG